MTDLSLNILDITENSINADAKNIEISITEDTKSDLMTIEITDDGNGIEEEMLKKITDPFITTRTTRKVGLGIPLMKSAADTCNGNFKIESEKGKGTKITVRLQLSHIDRQPLGNMTETILVLAVSDRIFNLKYYHKLDEQEFEINLDEFKDLAKQLGIGNNEYVFFLKKYLNENYNNFKTIK